jgi:hypothetical protein
MKILEGPGIANKRCPVSEIISILGYLAVHLRLGLEMAASIDWSRANVSA